ncbi:glycosyltransferase family 2 protein, partial [Escherichia coli]|uniref:glycosyltransferase family 2 protein n=2 Tax=Pseudomonadota TaxID=1224 RepID=UPI0013D89B25
FLNYLLPRKDLIQLPVVSLERGYGELIAGTYMDEFAEWHAKDLVVREALAKAVPSAGVGTCFSRRAMQALKAHNHDEPFNTASLTEDYD